MAAARQLRKYCPWHIFAWEFLSSTLGTESSHARNIAIQLKDQNGRAIAEKAMVEVFLSDSSVGVGLCSSAPSSGWAIGTNGTLFKEHTTNKYAVVETNASGQFDLTITEATLKTFYFVVIHPSRKLVDPIAIAFAG